MRHKTWLLGCCASSLVASAAFATPAWSAAADDPASSITEVIVTASKREQNLQDTPVAVTSVGEGQLKALNVVSISELTQIAPSLNFVPAPSPATTMFVIRGVGTFAFNDALEQSVGLVLDGVPMARLVGSISDAVDIGQVQLLRGPQGTIFGKNATAGLIAIDYREPTFDTTFDGRVFLGTYNERRFQGTGNIPLIADKLAVRVSAWNFHRDGYIDAPLQPKGKIGGLDNRGGRIKALITPTENLTINLTSEVRNDHYDGNIQTARGYILSPTTGQLQNGLEAAINGVDRANGVVAGPNNLLSFKDTPEFTSIYQNREVGKIVYDMGSHSLTAIGGYVVTRTNNYLDSDYTKSVLPMLQPGITHYRSKVQQYTGELRLANASTEDFKYTVGLFYYDVHVLSHQNGQTPTVTAPPVSFDTLNDAHTKNYAAFADVSYDINKLTLYAGARLSREETKGRFDRTKSLDFPTQTVVGGGGLLSVVAKPNTYKDFSYRAGAQYHATDDIMIYASTSRAYKGPGLNFGPTFTAAQFALNGGKVEAEIAKNYEIGLRSQFFDKQLTFNLTGFYSRYTDFQVTAVLPTTPTSFTTVNAPLLIAKGVELEFAYVPYQTIPGLRFDGNVVWNDTHYGDFKNAPCFTGQPVAAAATSTPGVCSPQLQSNGSLANVQNVSGLRAVGAPEWQVNLTGRYEHTVGDWLGFGQVHYIFTDDTQYGVNKNPQSIQKAYSTVDLSVGVGAPDKRWVLTAYLRNAFDKRFASRISVANPTINQSISFAAVRSGGVSLDVAF